MEPFTVHVDAVAIRVGGGLVVLHDLLRAMAAHEAFGSLTVSVSSDQAQQSAEAAGVSAQEIYRVGPGPLARVAWILFGAARRTSTLCADVVVYLANVGFARGAAPAVVLVHQPNPFSTEVRALHDRRDRIKFAVLGKLIAQSVVRADGVMVQTEAMQQAVARTCGVSTDAIGVFLPSVSKELAARAVSPPENTPPPKEFTVLYVGDDSAHKNLGLLLKAAGAMADSPVPVRFVATVPAAFGRVGDARFTPIGPVSHEQALGLIQQADVLVMPSIVETIGLPMLEAMRLGTPVLAADRPYARTVCRDAALYFEPTDARSLVQGIERLYADGAVGAALVERGRQRLEALDAAHAYRAMGDYISATVARSRQNESAQETHVTAPVRVWRGMKPRLKSAVRRAASRSGFIILRKDLHHNLVCQIHDVHSAALVRVPEVAGRTELLAGLMGTDVSQAMHLIHWLHATHDVAGEVCEFGVAQGATTAVLAHELLSVGDRRDLWLFDSFAGLPPPTDQDVMIDDVLGLGSMAAYAGTMALPRSAVERQLRKVGYPEERCHIRAGFVTSETGVEIMPDAVSFAYIDFDLYQPIKNALRLVDHRISSGGVIVVDDYGYFSAGARTAVDEFASTRTDHYEVEVGPIWAGHFAVLRRR